MEEKLIVCLRMAGNKGKTKTITALADLLIPDPSMAINQANAEWRKPKFSQTQKIEKWPKKISEWNSDICVAVNVNIKEKEKRIGLCSGGDKPSEIREHLQFLKEEKCIIIFCACRSRNPTAGIVEKMAAESGYTLIWTAPYTDTTPPGNPLTQFQKELNQKKAKHLADFIDME
jgi:hypothetical protein